MTDKIQKARIIATLCDRYDYAADCLCEFGDDPREELEISFTIRRGKKKKKTYRISLWDPFQREKLHGKIKELLGAELDYHSKRIKEELSK